MSQYRPLGTMEILAGSTDLPVGCAVRFDGTDWELCAAGVAPDAIVVSGPGANGVIPAGQRGTVMPIKAATTHIIRLSGTPAAGANLYVTTGGVYTSTSSGNGSIRGKLYKTSAGADTELAEAFLFHAS
jgi:hypothetical protein